MDDYSEKNVKDYFINQFDWFKVFHRWTSILRRKVFSLKKDNWFALIPQKWEENDRDDYNDWDKCEKVVHINFDAA